MERRQVMGTIGAFAASSGAGALVALLNPALAGYRTLLGLVGAFVALGGIGTLVYLFTTAKKVVVKEPRRDTTLTEAVCWVALGKWGLTVWNDGGGQLDKIIPTVELIRQAAADGHITIWGKASRASLYTEIPREFWHHNRIDELSLYRSTEEQGGDRGAESSSLRQQGGREYQHLMVSRAELEREFSARSASVRQPA